MEAACDACHITLNKNAVHGDASAMTPGGVRIGAPAMTSRGLGSSDFEKIAEFLHRVVQVSLAIQEASGKKLADFMAALATSPEIAALREEVIAWSSAFAMPGFDVPEN